MNFHNATEMLATYAGRASDMERWLADAEINDDMSMRLQYLAGMGLNEDNPATVYNEMLAYRRFPPDIFSGSAERIATLQSLLAVTSH